MPGLPLPADLASYLSKPARITLTDGRRIYGSIHCFDYEVNVIVHGARGYAGPIHTCPVLDPLVPELLCTDGVGQDRDQSVVGFSESSQLDSCRILNQTKDEIESNVLMNNPETMSGSENTRNELQKQTESGLNDFVEGEIGTGMYMGQVLIMGKHIEKLEIKLNAPVVVTSAQIVPLPERFP